MGHGNMRQAGRKARAVILGAVLAALLAVAGLSGCSSGNAAADGPVAPSRSAPHGAGGSGSGTATAPPSGAVPDLSGEEIASVHDAPVGVEDDGVVELGDPAAPVVLDAYEDYLCDACGQLSRIYDEDVYDAISRGELAMRYHTITLLDGKSASGDYSTRAAAAALCVADSGDASAYSRYRNALFRKNVQPTQGGHSDRDDAGLAEIAAQTGADEQAQECIRSGARIGRAAHDGKAARTSLAALSGGETITPSIYRGHHELPITKSGWLNAALHAS